jgi:hypothetical protein
MDKLSLWDKIKLKSGFAEPKTGAEYRYIMGELATPDIPTAVLKDAYEGSKTRYYNSIDDLSSPSDYFEMALKKRLESRNVPQRGVAFSPTGADMFDLWNPPLRVQEYSAMPDLWSNKKAQ